MNEERLINVDKEFYDLSFRLSKEVEEKFLDIQNKMVLGERFEDDLTNGGAEWNKFTQELFQRLKLEHPSHFITKEDLSKIIVRIGNAGKATAKELNCGGYYLEQWNFFFTMSFSGDFASTSFQGAIFYSDVTFQYSKFHEHSCFHETTFLKTADFKQVDFYETADFSEAHFKDFARFDQSKFFTGFDFSRSNCEKRLDLRDILFPKDSRIKCNFREANFYGDLVLNQDFERNSKNYSEVSTFDISGAYFYSTFDISLAFHSCPELSESRLLGEKFIKETWLEEGKKIPDSDITRNDVEKFRFFKNYFKEKGNHFKEAEYFAYEMIAVKERKKAELNEVKTSKNEKCRCFFTLLFSCKRWKQLFTSQYWDLFLFKAYDILSGCGISISRPLKRIVVSLMVFSLIFWIFFPKEFVPKTKQDLAVTHNINSDSYITQNTVILSAAKDLRSLNSEFNCTRSCANAQDYSVVQEASFGVIASKTFLFTINPFGSFKAVENATNPCFIFLVGLQAILNIAFLFLLALGIRNRFKLK